MNDHKGLVFRLNDHGQGPELIRQVFLERGWTEFDEDTQEEYDYNLWWRTSRFKMSDYDQMFAWQRFNHYPKTTGITKKDCLARNLRRMRGVHGASTFNFSPIAFNLPNDYTRFVSEYTKQKEKDVDKSQYWICKPADLSRGRGIFIFKELGELQYDCNAVVQKYITNPLLISGYKFDLRIYVVVPSFHPLNIYIYQEGLVRFSTEKFDLSSLGNMYAHLTNTSINKHSPTYTSEKERVGAGCKWTLTQLRYYFHQNNLDDHLLWPRIINIVILTILTQASQVPTITNCFELYGFDIIIDSNMKPWLLEVNFSPAMSSDCHTDQIVKKPMLNDIFNMLNYQDIDKERGGDSFRQLHQHKSPTKQSARQVKSLQQRPLMGKLPNIPSTSSRSSNNSCGEGESDEENVTPMVPGCGLPSVQDPSYSSKRKHSSESSGCSSAGSTRSDQSSKMNLSVKDSQSMIGGAGGLKRIDSKSSLKRVDSKGKQLHKISEGFIEDFDSVDSSYTESQSAVGSTLLCKSKTFPFDIRDSSSNVDVTKEKRTNNAFKQKTAATELRPVRTYKNRGSQEDISSLQINGIMSTNTSLGGIQPLYSPAGLGGFNNVDLNQRFNESVEEQEDSPVNPLLLKSYSPRREMTDITPRRKSVSFTSNPLVTKTNVVRRNSVTSLASLPRRKPSYPRPWRSSKTPGISLINPGSQVKRHSPSQIGDFVLALPFNEVTRKSVSNSSLDEKAVIRECQKFLKLHSDMKRQGVTDPAIRKVKMQKMTEMPVLWPPIIMVTDTQSPHTGKQ